MNKSRNGWLFAGPSLVHLIVFAIGPIVAGIWLSLTAGNMIKGESHFVGINNYRISLTEAPFWNALWNSLRFAAMSVPLSMLVALFVALLVNQKLRGMTIFRTIYYLPSIASAVAISMMWIYIYLPETGFIATVLSLFGVKDLVKFLDSEVWAMPCLAFMSAWTGLGPKMVLFVAGLLSVPATLYEAAEIDGASKTRSLISITLPMLKPTTFFVLVTSTISALQVFTPVYMMTKGGPNYSTDVVGYHIYTEAWVNFNVGIAAAKSVVLFLLIASISYFQFRAMKESA